MTIPQEKQFQKNPYPGIRSFEIDESHLFFGRDEQTDDLYNILNSTHFIAITGASGSGKSSLVKAGLIPKIHDGSDKWIHYIFRPGSDPIGNFAQAIYNSLRSEEEFKENLSRNEIEKIIRTESNPIETIFSSFKTDKQHLIYIDQFEEIFRFRQNEFNEKAEHDSDIFVNTIIKASEIKKLPIYSIITLRTDFLSDCSNFAGLTKIINDGHYLIPRMTHKEKEEALTGPAQMAGANVSGDLIELIKKHLKEYNISLPVFQHALMRTWDYWLENAEYGKAVDIEHYEAVGTVTDALSVHAEYIYTSLPDENSKKIVEKIFKSLTHLGDDNRGTRSPKSLEDIIAIVDERKEEIELVINSFRGEKSGFLLPSTKVKLKPETIIDISHESIMRVWGRLVQWVQKETESAQLYLRISKNAELYQESKTGLLINPDLQLALKWQDENNPNEFWAQRYDPAFHRAITYLGHSKKKWANDIAAKEEKQRRGLRRARFFAIFLGSASLISILFMVIALNLKFKADDSKREALEKEKVAIQKSVIAEDKKREAVSHKRIAEQQQEIAEEQRLIAEENKQYAVSQQKEAIFQKQLAVIAQREAEKSRDIARDLQLRAEKLRDEAFQQKMIAENQKLRAEQSEAKTDTLRRLAIAKSMSAQAVKIYNNNKKVQKLSEYEKKLPLILALQSYYFNNRYKGNENDPDIFSALLEVSETGTAIRGKNMHSDGIRDIAISKSGKYFISGSDDRTVMVFDLDKLDNPVKLTTDLSDENSIRSVDINTAENKIIAGTYSGELLLWNTINSNQKPKILKGHSGVVNKVSFSSTGDTIFSVSNDGTLRLWNLKNENPNSKVIISTSDQITDFRLDPDEERYAVALSSGQIIIRSLNDPSDEKIIKGEDHKKVTALFWKDSKVLIAGYSSGIVRVIENNNFTEEFFAHQSGITSVFYDANYNRIISSSYDGTIKIWNYDNVKLEPITLIKHSSWVYCVTALPDGNQIISGSADKQIVITPINVLALKTLIRQKVSENMSLQDWYRFVGRDIEYSNELPM